MERTEDNQTQIVSSNYLRPPSLEIRLGTSNAHHQSGTLGAHVQEYSGENNILSTWCRSPCPLHIVGLPQMPSTIFLAASTAPIPEPPQPLLV